MAATTGLADVAGDAVVGAFARHGVAGQRACLPREGRPVLQPAGDHGDMGVVEGQDMILEMPIPMLAQPLPARADIDAGELQAPEQGRGIHEIEQRARGRAPDMAVVDPQHLLEAALLDEEERQMPPLMDRERRRRHPMGLQPAEPGDALALAALHLQHMGDGMDRPCIGGIALDGAAARRLGRAIVAALLQPEGMHAQEIAVELMVRRPDR